ncbi:MAG: heme-binding domain-containing protein [Flavobacteriales bacterium]|nr:heme-binding domain-containing protein [Flavobacteriales bacterium]
MKKRIALILIALFALAQLIQPDRSVPAPAPANDMLTLTQAPPDIRVLVEGACYDCHSDKSTYPWYAYVTPMNFWLQSHINEGREKMNFSRWNDPASREEAYECGEVLREGEMPPKNYAFIHGHAQLTDAQRGRLVDWFDAHMPKEDGSGAEHEENHD